MLQGESHDSRIQTRLFCNSICRPYMSRFVERSHKIKASKKDKKNDNSSHRKLGLPVIERDR